MPLQKKKVTQNQITPSQLNQLNQLARQAETYRPGGSNPASAFTPKKQTTQATTPKTTGTTTTPKTPKKTASVFTGNDIRSETAAIKRSQRTGVDAEVSRELSKQIKSNQKEQDKIQSAINSKHGAAKSNAKKQYSSKLESLKEQRKELETSLTESKGISKESVAAQNQSLEALRKKRAELALKSIGGNSAGLGTGGYAVTPEIKKLDEQIRKAEKKIKDDESQLYGYNGKSKGAVLAERAGRTIAGSAQSVGSSALETAGQLTRMAAEDAQYAPGTELQANAGLGERTREEMRGTAESLFGKADTLAESSAENLEAAKAGASALGKIAVDLGSEGLKLAGDVAMNTVAPGSGMAALGVRAFGSGAQEARRAGATEEQQYAYGAATAAIEVFTERLSSQTLPFKKAYGGTAKVAGKSLDDLLDSTVARVTKNPTIQLFAKGFIGEGMEEVLSDALNPVAKEIYEKGSAGKTYFTSEGRKKLLEDMLYDGLIGGLLGSIGATGDVVKNHAIGDALNTAEKMQLLDNGLHMPGNSKSRPVADEIAKQLQKEQIVPAARFGELYRASLQDAEKRVKKLPDDVCGWSVQAKENGEYELVSRMDTTAEALTARGLGAADAIRQAQTISALLSGESVSNKRVKNIAQSDEAREVFAQITGAELPAKGEISVPKMAELLRAEAELYRAAKAESEEQLEHEGEAIADIRNAYEAAVAENEDRAREQAEQTMEDAMAEVEAESQQTGEQEAPEQQAQPRESYEEFAARTQQEQQRRFGWELTEEQINKAWRAATETDGIRLENGQMIGREAFYDVLRQYTEFKNGFTPTDEQLEKTYQEWRTNSEGANGAMSTELWNTMLREAGRAEATEATGADAQAQEATGADAQAQEATGTQEVETAEAPVQEKTPKKPKASEKPKTQRKPRQKKAKPALAAETTAEQAPVEAPAQAATGAQAQEDTGYWNSLLNETPPPEKNRRYSITVDESKAAAERGIKADTSVGREQLLTVMYLKPYLHKGGIDNVELVGEDDIHGGHGVWDPKNGVLKINKDYATTADLIVETVGHEIFHPATAQTRAESGKETVSIAEDFLTTLQKLADNGQLDGTAGTEIGSRLYNSEKWLEAYRNKYAAHYEKLGYTPEQIKSMTRDALMREEFACDLMGKVLQSQNILDRVAGVKPDLLTRAVRVVQRIKQSNPGVLYASGGADYREAAKEIDRIADSLNGALLRAQRAREAGEEAEGEEQYQLPVRFGKGADTYFVSPAEVDAQLQAARDSGNQIDADYFQAIKDNNTKAVRAQLEQQAQKNGYGPLKLYRGVIGTFTPESQYFTQTGPRSMFTTPSLQIGAHYGGRRDVAPSYRTIQSASLMEGLNEIVEQQDDERLVDLANQVLGTDYRYVSDEDKGKLQQKLAERIKPLSDQLESLREAAEAEVDMDTQDDIFEVMSFLDGVQAMAAGEEGWTIEELREMAETAGESFTNLDDYFEEFGDDLDGDAASFFSTINNVQNWMDIERALEFYEKIADPDLHIFNNTLEAAWPREQVAGRLRYNGNNGVYQLYGRVGDKPLWFDAEGAMWNELSFDQYDYVANPDGDSTDNFATWADVNGYSSLIVQNVVDGPVPSDDYIFFTSDAIKSADLITFDDDGKIIPPSQRFNPEEEDWRYSISVPVEGMYNLSERVISQTKQEKLGAGSVINMLRGKGVKAEEIKWLGIEDFLKGKKSVTKQELLDYIAANDLVIEEETLTQNGTRPLIDDATGEVYESYEDAYSALYDRLLGEGYDEETIESNLKFDDDFGFYWYSMRDGEEFDLAGYTSNVPDDETHWSQYTAPGGTNYREILFRLPSSDYSNRASKVHWGDEAPGVLAHARVQDFTTTDGRPILFIEEIQSDWHNEGQRLGYVSEKNAGKSNSAAEELRALEAENNRLLAEYHELLPKLDEAVFNMDEAMGGFAHTVLTKLQPVWGEMYSSKQRANIASAARSYAPISEIMTRANDEYGVYLTDADGDALSDYLELVRHRQAIDRQLETIQEEGERVEYALRQPYEGNAPYSVPDAPFANNYTDFVLKRMLREAAESGYAGVAWTSAQMQADRWSDEYMEGYRIEYDQDIPKFLNKFGKKFGARVGTTEIWGKYGAPFTVPFIPVTDSMRASVMTEGLPKFSIDVSLEDQIKAVKNHRMPRGHYVYYGSTTQRMKDVGFPDRADPILQSPRKVGLAMQDKDIDNDSAHGITDWQMTQIPRYLDDPVMVVDVASDVLGHQPSVLFVTDMLDGDGFPIVAAVNANAPTDGKAWAGMDVGSLPDYVSEVATVYGRGPVNSFMPRAVTEGPGSSENGKTFEDFIRQAMEKDNILYISDEGVKNLLRASNEWQNKKNQPRLTEAGNLTPRAVGRERSMPGETASQAEGAAGSNVNRVSPAAAFVKRTEPKPLRDTAQRAIYNNWVSFPEGFADIPRDTVLHESRNITAPVATDTEATNPDEQYAINVEIPEFEEYMRRMQAMTAERNANRPNAAFPTKAEYDRSMGVSAEPSEPFATGAAARGFVQNRTYDSAEAYAAALEQYGAMPTRPNLQSDLPVPRQTGEDNRVSRIAQSAINNRFVTPQMLKTLNKAVADGKLSYFPISDQASQTRVKATMKSKGWERALADWTAEVKSGKVTKDNVTMGLMLYNASVAAGDGQRAIEILVDLSENVRSGAQAVQAMSMLDKMTPEGKLVGLQRSIQNLEQEIRDRLGDRAPENLEIDPKLLQSYLDAKTDAERDKIMGQIYQNIADQIPATWADKFNNWRYMAMLANPRTHIRNMVGNAGFAPVRGVKNVVATGLEKAFIGKKGERTKSIVMPTKFLKNAADKARYQAAIDEWDEVEPLIQSGGKFKSEWNEIRDRQTIYRGFSNPDTALKKAANFVPKGVEAVRKFNSKALDVEDVWFSKPAYASSLAQYLKANGITAEQYNSPGFDKTKAREYAIKEAQKATYRDFNAFSDMVSGLGFKNPDTKAKKAVNTFVEAVLPFKRTPANILVRGMEYSPIGLMNGLKQAMFDVRKGNKTAAEAIDSIASGLTGTGLLGLGILLAKQGLLSGGAPEKEKDEAMNKLTGHQNYALEIGDKSYTLDWLAPEALPVFVGVELYKTLKDGMQSGDDLFKPITRISEPVLEMSMLQSLNDMIDSVGYKGDAKLWTLLASAATSYLTQYVPTLGGQIERTVETTQQRTYTDKNSPIPTDVQYALAKALNKLPKEYDQIEYVDEWGRTHDTGSFIERALTNFLSPGYYSKVYETEVDKMLKAIVEETGDRAVYPAVADKSIKVGKKEHDLTAEQYTEYTTKLGQTRYDLLDELRKSSDFKDMSATEKAALVAKVYEYAKATSQKALYPKKEVDNWVTDAGKAKSEFNISTSEYIRLISEYGSSYLSGDETHAKAIKAYKAGVPLEKYLEAKAGKSKYDADDNDSYTNAETIRAYTSGSLDEKEQQAMLSLELDESAVKKYTGARAIGMSADKYVSLLEDTAQEKMPADKKSDGKTISGSRKEKVVAYLSDQVQKGYITEEQKSFFIHDVYGWK